MQVNLSTNMPNAAGEASAKSSEPADTGSASAFFIQMGQIWNPGNEENAPQNTAKPAETASNTACPDLLSLMLGAALISSQPTGSNSVPAQNISSPATKTIQDNTAADAVTKMEDEKKCPVSSIAPEIEQCISAHPVKGMKGVKTPLDSVDSAQSTFDIENAAQLGTPTEISIQTEASPAVKIESSKNLQNDVEPKDIPVTVQDSPKTILDNIISMSDSAINAVALSSKLSAKSQPVLQESEPYGVNSSKQGVANSSESGIVNSSGQSLPDSNIEMEADANVAPKDLGLGINLQSKAIPALPSGKAVVNPAGQGTSRTEPAHQQTAQKILESIQRENGSPIILRAEVKESLTNQSGLNLGPTNADVATKAEPSQDSDSRSDLSKLTILKKDESFVQSNPGNTNAGDSSANQDQPHGESSLFAAQAIKQDGNQSGFAQLRPSTGEKPQEAQTAFAVNVTRAPEARNLTNESAAPASSSQPRELVLQVADQIRVQLRDGKEEIRIQLKPESLGHLEIKAETTLNGVTARITTESNNVKSYLENNLQFLQQTLQDQGLKVERIHIVVQDAFSSQSPSGFAAHSGHANSGQDGRESQTHTQSSGSSQTNTTDEMTVDPLTWISLNPNSRFHTVA